MTINSVINQILPYAVGFGVVTFLMGHFLTMWLVNKMWEFIKSNDPESNLLGRYPEQAQIVGIIERTLYFAALAVNQPIFIGIWLTLKTVARPLRWRANKGAIPGRAIFQPFLAGNGFSLLFAGAGHAITFLLQKNYANSNETVLAILLGLLVIWLPCMFIAHQSVQNIKKKRTSNKGRRR
jgi:cytochrome c biogenesis protein CcdA